MRLLKVWSAAFGVLALATAVYLNPPTTFRLVVWYPPEAVAFLAYLAGAAGILLPLLHEGRNDGFFSGVLIVLVAVGSPDVRMSVAAGLFAIFLLIHVEYAHAISRFREWEDVAHPESSIGKEAFESVERVLRRYVASSVLPLVAITALVALSLVFPRVVAPVLPGPLADSLEWRGVYGLFFGSFVVLGITGAVSLGQSVKRRREQLAAEAAAERQRESRHALEARAYGEGPPEPVLSRG